MLLKIFSCCKVNYKYFQCYIFFVCISVGFQHVLLFHILPSRIPLYLKIRNKLI